MREIPLSNGGFAIVDDEDFERLSRHAWSRTKRGYATRSAYVVGSARKGSKQRVRAVQMHREVLNDFVSPEVDHINGMKLDNRKQNLRPCTHQQNNRNRVKQPNGTRSAFKGVTRKLGIRTFEAAIWVDRHRIYLGRFADEEAAARAYDDAARREFGEFARLNFPMNGEQPARLPQSA